MTSMWWTFVSWKKLRTLEPGDSIKSDGLTALSLKYILEEWIKRLVFSLGEYTGVTDPHDLFNKASTIFIILFLWTQSLTSTKSKVHNLRRLNVSHYPGISSCKEQETYRYIHIPYPLQYPYSLFYICDRLGFCVTFFNAVKFKNNSM